MDELPRLHRAPHARRARCASARHLRGRGRRRQRRLHRHPRPPAGAGRAGVRTASRFDTTGSDPQRRAPVNSTSRNDVRTAAYALKCLVDPDLPVNDGFYRLDRRSTHRRARVTNCPLAGGRSSAAGRRTTRLVEVIIRALLPAFPERLPAGTKGMMCQAGFGSLDVGAGRVHVLLRHVRRRLRRRGYASDGPDAVQAHGQNTENAPIEETELNYPVRIHGLALVENSEGPGRFRGGLGLRKDYRFDRARRRSRSSPTATASARGARSAGTTASVAEYVLVRDGVETRLGFEGDRRTRARRRDQRADVRRRRLRAARGARARRPCCATSRREGQSSSALATSTGSCCGTALSTRLRRRSCARDRLGRDVRDVRDVRDGHPGRRPRGAAEWDMALTAARVTHLPPLCDRA